MLPLCLVIEYHHTPFVGRLARTSCDCAGVVLHSYPPFVSRLVRLRCGCVCSILFQSAAISWRQRGGCSGLRSLCVSDCRWAASSCGHFRVKLPLRLCSGIVFRSCLRLSLAGLFWICSWSLSHSLAPLSCFLLSPLVAIASGCKRCFCISSRFSPPFVLANRPPSCTDTRSGAAGVPRAPEGGPHGTLGR